MSPQTLLTRIKNGAIRVVKQGLQCPSTLFQRMYSTWLLLKTFPSSCVSTFTRHRRKQRVLQSLMSMPSHFWENYAHLPQWACVAELSLGCQYCLWISQWLTLSLVPAASFPKPVWISRHLRFLLFMQTSLVHFWTDRLIITISILSPLSSVLR